MSRFGIATTPVTIFAVRQKGAEGETRLCSENSAGVPSGERWTTTPTSSGNPIHSGGTASAFWAKFNDAIRLRRMIDSERARRDRPPSSQVFALCRRIRGLDYRAAWTGAACVRLEQLAFGVHVGPRPNIRSHHGRLRATAIKRRRMPSIGETWQRVWGFRHSANLSKFAEVATKRPWQPLTADVNCRSAHTTREYSI